MTKTMQLTRIRKVCFAIGGIPYQLTSCIIGFFFQFYLLSVAQLTPFQVAIVLFTGQAWDAITDPIVGWLITQTPNTKRYGRKIPWIIISSPLAALTYVFLWTTPMFDYKLPYYVFIHCLFETLQTCFRIPYSTLTVLISHKQKARDSATMYRMTAEVLGMLIGAVIQGLLVGDVDCFNKTVTTTITAPTEHTKMSYIYAAIIAAIVYVVCSIILILGIKEMPNVPIKPVSFDNIPYYIDQHITNEHITNEHITNEHIYETIDNAHISNEHISNEHIYETIDNALDTTINHHLDNHIYETIYDTLDNTAAHVYDTIQPQTITCSSYKLVFTFKPYLILTTGFLFTSTAFMLLQGNFALFCNQSLGFKQDYQKIILTIIVSAAICVPICQWFLTHYTKKLTAFIGISSIVPIFIIITTTTPNLLGAYILAVGSGLGIATAFLLPWSMLPDVIDEFKLKHNGLEYEVLFYSLYILFLKFAIGMSMAMSTISLGMAGYITGSCQQPDSVNFVLKILVSVVPIVFIIIGLGILSFYKDHKNMSCGNMFCGTINCENY